MEFTAYLQKKLGEHAPNEIEELILDNLFKDYPCLTSDQRKALEQYTNLFHLSLNHLGLTKVENFPQIFTLQVLEINDNKLTGEDFELLPNLFPNLYKLKVSQNQILTLDVFKPFKSSKLSKIEIKNNPITQTNPEYKSELFAMIPGLKIVDNLDTGGHFVETTIYDADNDSSDEGGGEEEEEYEENEDEEEEEDDEDDEDEESYKR